MATVEAHPQTAASTGVDGAGQVADVFVIFGITGDLAKVMTFHSLYRLEQRGLLDCPIVGVAVRRLVRRASCASMPASAIEGLRRADRR